ncbi:hypothetical protein BDP27DRAFT_1451422 [Rhodocollybia butyracea]|uniref:Protein-S-isoprenylcysteine O-methyltransferase n=1 Tax=Rhodocollybia butyracea TaxID=206335 RepID=A0A9P5PGS7_9AGAR|nr:hypothetical protein BDP27DRAFT_1451422 [Rhodocollybia butyracea]
MSIIALQKIPLLLGVSILYYVAATPPNPPPSSKEISKFGPGDPLTPKVVSTPWAMGKNLLLFVFFCEILVIVATQFPNNIIAETALAILVRSSHAAPAITPIFLAGFGFLLCGGCIRWFAYRALGRLFTFEVSIRDEHTLITEGPYSFVRHPSYTGSFCTCVGVTLCLFGPGSWLFECGWLKLLTVQVFAVVITGLHASIVYIVFSRMSDEDRMMQKEFGLKWDEWAKAVPYKLVPGIF